ncbi:trypsin-like peptidase domain-containing protein [Bradyrhizobium oligotrophicum]|uniref:trypsin-like peptidase domain-containing protein n=1 Tax=Bradyrhizobium TaxID=374 RepID=UPI003EB94EA9
MKILKLFWRQQQDGAYAIVDMKGLDLLGPERSGQEFFAVRDDVVLTQTPPVGGTIRSALGESIVPVVAVANGERRVRCVGTAFFISCSGLLVTAAHVITDPIDRRYGNVREAEGQVIETQGLAFGVLVPNNPLFQAPGFAFYPFEWSMLMAQSRDAPFSFRGVDVKITYDIAICKVPARTNTNYPHQPLTLVQSGVIGVGMREGSEAHALGYADMSDFELNVNAAGQIFISQPQFDLHGSVGKIIQFFPDNLIKRDVSTPGPCFSFGAKIPGGMSGGPIFDKEGVYVYGVISKGWENQEGPENFSFGSMLRPSMGIPIARMGGKSLDAMQMAQAEGIAVLRGAGM